MTQVPNPNKNPKYPTHENNAICPECGTNGRLKYYYDVFNAEKMELGLRFKRMSAEHGSKAAEWELDRIRLTESMKWMQRKVLKQAKVIAQLEAKLRKLKQQPYKDTVTVRSMDGTETEVEV